MYQLTENPGVVYHISEQSMVAQNTWLWGRYQAWLGAGNTPLPVETVESPAAARARLKDAATEHRWRVETGGITVAGQAILTDTADQNRITTVLAAINLGLESVDFKSGTGWVRLTADDIRGIATMVSLHTQLCFSAEREHHEAIDECPDELLVSYDVTDNWPTGVY